MTGNTFLVDLLVLLLGRLPYLGVVAIGLIIAIVRRRQAPRAMKLVAIGCALVLVSGIGTQVFFTVLSRYFIQSGLMIYYQFISITFGLISTAGFLLVLLGAFAERTPVEARGFAVVTDFAQPSRTTPPPVPGRDRS